jgi:hypothetical protein
MKTAAFWFVAPWSRVEVNCFLTHCPDDGGSRHLLKYLPDYIAQHPRRHLRAHYCENLISHIYYLFVLLKLTFHYIRRLANSQAQEGVTNIIKFVILSVKLPSK